MKPAVKAGLMWAYELGSFGTTIFLLFFDHYRWTAWNWIIVIPIDIFLGQIWPIYWLILRPFA